MPACIAYRTWIRPLHKMLEHLQRHPIQTACLPCLISILAASEAIDKRTFLKVMRYLQTVNLGAQHSQDS